MPYRIDGNCVYKKSSSKPLKCFKTRQEALDYLAALEINVKDASLQDKWGKKKG